MTSLNIVFPQWQSVLVKEISNNRFRTRPGQCDTWLRVAKYLVYVATGRMALQETIAYALEIVAILQDRKYTLNETYIWNPCVARTPHLIRKTMGKTRLEAFSDGVIAFIITIMVLELKVPHEADFKALLPLWPVFMSYVLSFIYVGIYWNKRQYASHPPVLARVLEPV